MRTKLHKVMFSALLAVSVAVMMPSAAHAKRGGPGGGGGYVPAEQPGTPPVEVEVELPAAPVNPDLDGSGDGGDAGSQTPEVNGISVESPNVTPAVDSSPVTQDTPRGDPAPANDGVFGGVLSRTGAETMPLARAGLAAITLGVGLVMLGRRRRQAATSA